MKIQMSHLEETGWTYKQHFKADMYIAKMAFIAGTKALIHAIFPCFKLPGKGTRVIIREMEMGWRAVETRAIAENKAAGRTGAYLEYHVKYPGDRGYQGRVI